MSRADLRLHNRAANMREALRSSRAKLEGKDSSHWPFFEDRRLSKRAANKFLLGCMIDFQWNYETAWNRAREFAEDELGDPQDLWARMLRIPRRSWIARKGKRSLHRFAWRHRALMGMAEILQTYYRGDARTVWRNKRPLEVLYILENEIQLGPQVSRMTVGALLDEGEIDGGGQVKADVHVCRTLGRVFFGEPAEPASASRLAMLLDRRNPWQFDYLLWRVGRDYCKATHPKFRECPIVETCLYGSQRGRA